MSKSPVPEPTNSQLNHKLNQILYKLDNHEDKLKVHDDMFEKQTNQINKLIELAVKNEQKIDDIDHRTRLIPDHDTYLKHQDMLYRRLDRIEEALIILTGNKDQLEDHETRIDKLETIIHN